MAKRSPEAGTPALRLLADAAISFTQHSYSHTPGERHFGDETAAALGVDPDLLYKTLLASTDKGLVVGVLSCSHQLDLKALAAVVGAKKASMADPRIAERSTGYVVGGISPLGQKTPLPTVLDERAFDHELIYVSGGRRGLQVRLSPDDLQHLTGAHIAAISRS